MDLLGQRARVERLRLAAVREALQPDRARLERRLHLGLGGGVRAVQPRVARAVHVERDQVWVREEGQLRIAAGLGQVRRRLDHVEVELVKVAVDDARASVGEANI